jgi:hypothetical protein
MNKKKPRPDPMSEGNLERIFKWFFRPLMLYKPADFEMNGELVKNVSNQEWLEYLFHLNERDITRYRAREDFKMPGLFMERPHRKIQGIGHRWVLKSQEMWVRKDAREQVYHVEFNGGRGDAEQVFELDEFEWNSVAAKLEVVPFRGEKK